MKHNMKHKMIILLSSNQTPIWVHLAALAAMRRDPYTALNEVYFLADAIREWAWEQIKAENLNGHTK